MKGEIVGARAGIALGTRVVREMERRRARGGLRVDSQLRRRGSRVGRGMEGLGGGLFAGDSGANGVWGGLRGASLEMYASGEGMRWL